MWTSTSMTFGESLVVSALGLLVVFSMLCILAIAITLFAKAFSAVEKKPAADGGAVGAAAVDMGVYARIIAVVCEEMNARPEEITIKSIRKLD